MMLELNNYYIQELENLTDLFTNIFVIIDDICNEIIPIGIRNRRNIKDSKLSDSEIITISIVGELLTIDSEKSFFSLIDCQYKCNTLYSCCIKYLCRCLISKTLARSIIYYGNNIIKFFLIYRRKIKLFRVKLS